MLSGPKTSLIEGGIARACCYSLYWSCRSLTSHLGNVAVAATDSEGIGLSNLGTRAQNVCWSSIYLAHFTIS